jgi:hypothetical protein
MLHAALLGGLFNGVLSALPIVSLGNYCCCCAWVIGGGVVAAYVEQQNAATSITPARGAQAGLLAGVVGAFVWLLLTRALDAMLGPYLQMFVEMARNASDMPPEAREVLDSMSRYEGSRYAGGFAMMLVIGSIFSTIGGVIGAVYFRRDLPPALGGPIAPPPLP